MKLSEYQGVEDLKNMTVKDMEAFSNEIREFLILSLSKTGGHLASNLGVVELSLAIHKVYDGKKDKIIWDVGHQTYIHKILTGRKNDFDKLRQFKGLSGFPKRKESEYDVFDTGHSSTSISAGLGYVLAKEIKGEDYEVVSVIGDGAMTSGMSFEALNHAGYTQSNLTVILNDNEMSISENVGGLSKYLYKLRLAKGYYKFKRDIKNIVKKIPIIGNVMFKTIEKLRDGVKYSLVPGVFFEDIGFKYMGPIDGHDIEKLIEILEMSKNIKGPKLIHVITKKGKGYSYAEKDPEAFHGVSQFNVETGKSLKVNCSKTYSDVLGETLMEMAKTNDDIVAITAAMPAGTGLDKFKKKYPNRFFDVGIAEQHGVTLAAGMASNGIKPYIAIYSTFLQRAYDQILHDVCIQDLPIVIAVDRAGLVGEDGETHHGVFDISFLSHIPNMTIVSPKDKTEFIDMIKFSKNFNHPLVIRYSKGVCDDLLDYTDYAKQKIIYGKSETILKGKELALVAIGSMVKTAYDVACKLKEDGIDITLINGRFVKPIDKNMVKDELSKYKKVITLEDSSIIGGYGSLVTNELVKIKYQGEIENLGIDDKFIEHGSMAELYESEKLDFNNIYKKIKFFLEGNNK